MRYRLSENLPPLSLLLLALIGIQGSLTAAADVKPIAISQDGDKNVNVIIDSDLIPSAQIKRKEDGMVIQIPDQAISGGFDPSKLLVDPALRGKVDIEKNTEDRKTVVTIHSGNIYLSIDNQEGPTAREATPPKAAAPAKAATEAKRPAASPQPAMVLNPFAQLLGHMSSKPPQPSKKPHDSAAILMALGEKTDKALPKKHPVEKTPPRLAHELMEQQAILTLNGPASSTKGKTKPARPPKADEAAKAQQPQAPVETTPESTEENIPLSQVVPKNGQTVATDGTPFRILFSLIFVLSLLFAFVKLALPKLMDRFPGLFRQLKQQNSKQQAFSSLLKQKGEGLKGILAKKGLPVPTQPLHEAFTVVDSSAIGPDHSLYLVKFKDRQLVIGATSQSLSLITEVDGDEEVTFEAVTAEAAATFPTKPPEAEMPRPSLASRAAAIKASESRNWTSKVLSSHQRAAREAASIAAPEPERIQQQQYQQQQAPMASVTPRASFESSSEEIEATPKSPRMFERLHSALRQTEVFYQEPTDNTYYEPASSYQEIPQAPRPSLKTTSTTDLPSDLSWMPFASSEVVDAEDVVVLQDYDDEYQN